MSTDQTDERIGVIGGSGFYGVEGVEVIEEVSLVTPFGAPSDNFKVCRIDGREVVFLARHGPGHGLLPGEIPFRANLYGFKQLGVTAILAMGAVGSMKEHIHPRDVVVPDQFIDRTRGRVDTFFGDGAVAHIAFGDPICAGLAGVLADCAEAAGAQVHRGGTYLCMEGPAFSTRAESQLYRSWGVDVIGMTNLQEAKLAREAEICYATMALVTDYDCWHETEEAVSVEAIIGNLQHNTALAMDVVQRAVRSVPDMSGCPCRSALRHAVITDPKAIPEETRRRLDAIIGKCIQ